MKDKAYIRALMDYNKWANGVVYRSVGELPEGEVTKERPNLMKSMLGALNHLLTVDMIWMAHLEGRDHGMPELRPMLHDNLDDLWEARKAMDDKILAYIDALDPDALEEEVDYELIGGNKGRLSRAMILTHLATHGCYHRGWVADMYGQLPQIPPIFDIPVYERARRDPGGESLTPLP